VPFALVARRRTGFLAFVVRFAFVFFVVFLVVFFSFLVGFLMVGAKQVTARAKRSGPLDAFPDLPR
jgi:hypothetical protein